MSFVVTNNAFSKCGLRRAVGASGFPNEDFTITWQIYLTADRTDAFQTYATVGPDTFDIQSNYWVCFDGNGAVAHTFALGSDATDTYHGSATPDLGRWYRMAYRRRRRGANDHEQFFYFDLPDTGKVISKDDTDGLTYNTGTDLVFGYAPWVVNEGITGRMRCLKAFSSVLTPEQLVLESAYADVADHSLQDSLWGRWPCVSDGNDSSPNARHLSINETVTFDNEVAPLWHVWRGGMSEETLRRRFGRSI